MSLTLNSRTSRRHNETRRYSGIARQPFTLDLLTGNNIDQNVSSPYYKRHVIPDLKIECKYCKAVLFYKESTNFCCFGGKVQLPDLPTDPPELRNLLSGTAQESAIFLKNIRAFNSSLAFASLCANINEALAKSHRGVYTFEAQGMVYHNIGPLEVQEGEHRKFAQIYLWDAQQAGHELLELENRLRYNNQLDNEHCRSILKGVYKPLYFPT